MDDEHFKNRRLLKILLFSILAALIYLPSAAADPLPFSPGEKLTFELRWEFVKAGKAVLQVMPVIMKNGVISYHFVLEARTNKYLDKIYKVRDRYDAWADLGMTRSVHFKRKQREGDYKRDTSIYFNWDKNEAIYIKKGKTEKTIPLLPGSFDPLSAFYYSRTVDPAEADQWERPVTDGKKNVMGKAKIVGKETIELNGKFYNTYLIEPDLKDVGGVFKKSKNAKIQIWVTADDKRIPLRLKSKVAVGTFVGELVSTEGVDLGTAMAVQSAGR